MYGKNGKEVSGLLGEEGKEKDVGEKDEEQGVRGKEI